MENRIKTSMTGLLGQAIKAEDGADAYGGILVRTTATVLRAARVGAESALGLQKAAAKEIAENKEAVVSRVVQARVLLALFRDLGKPTFGNQWNPRWLGTGWDTTLELPESPAALVVHLNAAAKFMEANPALELPARNVTAAALQLEANDLRAAVAAVEQQKALLGQLLNDRNTKFAALRKVLRDLLKELSSALDRLDPRWKAFGFNMPGAHHIPEVPLNFIVAMREGNAILLTWNASARAEYYRVFKRVIGVDPEFVLVSSQNGLDALVTSLPANAQVELAVAAVNRGGESGLSQVISIQTVA